MTKTTVKPASLPSRKFYFLDYFFIFLSSVEKNIIQDEVFNAFKILKQEYRLGESKYKILYQQGRYRYTFNKVMDECKEYGLLIEAEDHRIYLTNEGKRLLLQHRKEGIRAFNLSVFKLMEKTHNAFRTLVEFLYEANSKGSGVLVFPHYSPLELHFNRSNIQTTKDMVRYTESLVKKLKGDIEQYLKRTVDLTKKNQELLNKIAHDGLLSKSSSGRFDPKDYNKITKRIRDFWLTYFLQELYKCPYSMTSFDMWGYRARQIGVIQVTESYPFINGKLVYPTSVVIDAVHSDDFSKIYHYSDGKHLFVHKPTLGAEEESPYKEKFIDTLVKGYFDLRRQVRYNFINLASLREIVCFRLKISMHSFEETLNEIYRLNLSGQLKIRISLEVDKLPEETSALYMKQEPVMVDGSYRNIIAIDVAKGGPK
ncbi:hypothetical protein BMS3Bbin05_00353 [bacterium BMS3Bbin05]|nr:hypothetical protein BMS3Abin06_00009 [bacterium BMS3Abin06]GBE31452.1 hypothetical protein BMS3Bbin05_00353 [bacterium BMS3Bbin05]HDZ02503.1 hypothetical protein [Nitrospirota bacterium]